MKSATLALLGLLTVSLVPNVSHAEELKKGQAVFGWINGNISTFQIESVDLKRGVAVVSELTKETTPWSGLRMGMKLSDLAAPGGVKIVNGSGTKLKCGPGCEETVVAVFPDRKRIVVEIHLESTAFLLNHYYAGTTIDQVQPMSDKRGADQSSKVNKASATAAAVASKPVSYSAR